MTTIYHVHPVTGELLGAGKADPNPLEPGEWLIPAHAFTDEPPAAEKQKAIVRTPAGWSLVPDFRGAIYSTATGEESHCEELGEPPEGFTHLPWPGLDYYWQGDAWGIDEAARLKRNEQAERDWRNAELERVKWLRERHRDEQDIGRRLTLTVEQFSELLDYLQQLRDWPQSEQFPEVKHRPVAPPWIAEQAQ